MFGELILWVHFPVSHGFSYILLVVDYLSSCGFYSGSIVVVDSNDSIVVVDFVRSNIFCRFGVHRVIISDQGSHFYNRSLASLLQNYGVVHRVATTYHPQTDGLVMVFN